MTRLQVAIGCAVFIAAAVFLTLQHRAISKLKAENDALRESNGQVAQLETETQRLSNAILQANSSLSREQLSELLKLRSEVGFLRKQTNDLHAENRQLRAKVAAETPVAADQQPHQAYIPREEWAFAGYETPEAAMQSTFWAVKEADSKAYLTSMTPDMLERIQQSGIDTNDTNRLMAVVAEETGKIKGYQIMKVTFLTEDHALLDVAFGGEAREVKLDRNQGQWKLAGPITRPVERP